MGKRFLFVSGKGGVGKSTLAAAIAVKAADKGRRVALIDGDAGLRSLDLLLGLQDKALYDLADVAQRRSALDDAMVWHPVYPTLRLLAGGQQARQKDFSRQDLEKILATAARRFDLVIVDGPAGLGRGVKNFAGIVDTVVVVATPDAVCQRVAEKLTSQLSASGLRASLMLNRYQTDLAREGVLPQPAALAQALDVPLLGVVPESPRVYGAMLQGRTAAETGDAEMDQALEDALSRMEGDSRPLPVFEKKKLSIFQRVWKWLED